MLELEQPDVSEDVLQLIQETRNELTKHERKREFGLLERRQVTESMAREHLLRQGRALMTQLVAQIS